MTFTRKQITVKLNSGEHKRISALVLGDFAMHSPVNEKRNGYNITIVSIGYTVGNSHYTKPEAQRIIEQIQNLRDAVISAAMWHRMSGKWDHPAVDEIRRVLKVAA